MDGLSSRLQSLEHSYKHLESITFDVKNSANEWKNKYNEMKQVADSMKGVVLKSPLAPGSPVHMCVYVTYSKHDRFALVKGNLVPYLI